MASTIANIIELIHSPKAVLGLDFCLLHNLYLMNNLLYIETTLKLRLLTMCQLWNFFETSGISTHTTGNISRLIIGIKVKLPTTQVF